MKIKTLCFLYILILSVLLSGCNITVNGETVIDDSEEDIQKLKDTGNKIKTVITDEELRESINDTKDILIDKISE